MPPLFHDSLLFSRDAAPSRAAGAQGLDVGLFGGLNCSQKPLASPSAISTGTSQAIAPTKEGARKRLPRQARDNRFGCGAAAVFLSRVK